MRGRSSKRAASDWSSSVDNSFARKISGARDWWLDSRIRGTLFAEEPALAGHCGKSRVCKHSAQPLKIFDVVRRSMTDTCGNGRVMARKSLVEICLTSQYQSSAMR